MAIYFFDKNQTLIKIAPDSATFEAVQTQELDDDSLLKDTLSVTVKGDEKLLNAEYMAVKSYTGNAQTFDMYRIVTDSTPDKTMSFTGMSLAPYELNGHIIKDLRPANQSVEYTLNRILDGTDWRVGFIEDGLPNVTTTFYYVSAKEALKELQSLVGCEFVFKVEISGQKITDKWIEIYKEMGNRTKKRFNYGTNALTVVRETNKADIYTALIGRGKGEEVSSAEENESGQAGYGRKITFEDIEWSIAKGNPLDKPKGQYYLELPQATQVYGIKNIDGTMSARVGVVEFDDEDDKNKLINLTYQQLLVSSRPKVLFKTTVANIGATGIGDTVTIHRHDLGIHYQTRVRKIVRDKLNDNKTQIELGDAVVTASTKQSNKNNATIKNLTQELERVKVDVTTSQNSADGKNTIFYGSAEPERKRTGDTWFRPHPSIAGETQMLVWNGTAWELVLDSSDLSSVSREVEAAISTAEDAKALAVSEAEQALTDANKYADEKAEAIKQEVDTSVNTAISTAEDAKQTAEDSYTNAIADAQELVGAQSEAFNKKFEENAAEMSNLSQAARDADAKAQSALSKAGVNANLLSTHQNTLNTINNTTIPNINSTISSAASDAKAALSSASSAMDEARKADGKIADYVTRNGLVSGTTVDNKINEATGEISKKITTVESKIPTEIGGRNYFSLTNLNKIQPTNWVVRAYVYNFKLEPNTQYTLSSNVPSPNGDTTKTNIYFNGSGTAQNGVWEGNSITNTSDENGNLYVAIPTGRPYTQDILDGKYWVQLEKGTMKTDWTPAPEDNYTQEEFKIFESTYNEDVKGINSTLTELSNKKLDGTTYTTFYNNEYKQTAQGVTDTYTKLNKIIDANGNSTDAFAKAVYDKNATKQSADFNLVTKDLVKTATYTAGINGVKDSIASVKGDIDHLSKNINYFSVAKWESITNKPSSTAVPYMTVVGLKPNTKYTVSTNIPQKTDVYYDVFADTDFDISPVSSNSNGISNVKPKQVMSNNNGQIDVAMRDYDLSTGEWWIKVEEGEVATPWTPNVSDLLGKADFSVFKSDYERNDQEIKSRLTSIDSGKEGSVIYNANEALSTARGNTSSITTLSTKVDNLKVGGRNYLLNSGKPSALGSSSNNNAEYPLKKGVTDGAEWLSQSYSNGSNSFVISTFFVDTYDSSSFGKVFSNELLGYTGDVTYSADVMSEQPITVSLGTYGEKNKLEPNKWTRISTSVPRGNRPSGFSADPRDNVGIPVGTKLYWKNYKIEKGNLATDYSQAPEDMLGKETFTLFKNDYDETSKGILSRLTAIDSNASGSVVTRLNATEKTAEENKNTISKVNNIVTIQDTRNDNQPPSWYRENYPKTTVQEFKTVMAIRDSNIPLGSVYGILTTTIVWSNTSGGTVQQVFTVDEKRYVRRGWSDDSKWTPWTKMTDQEDIKNFVDSTSTEYQTIRERSNLYERVIGSSSEAGIKQNISRIVMTDSAFQTEVVDRQNLLTAMASGTGMTSDPYFDKGNNDISIYDNGRTGTIEMVRENPSNSSQPNGKWRLKFVHGASTATTPNRGGLARGIQSWRNGTVVIKFVAYLPKDRSFTYHHNQLGTGGTHGWLTDNKGTGTWETYMYYHRFGYDGTFSTFGFLSVNGSSSEFTWFLSEYDIINVNETTASKITQLSDNINLKVSKDDISNQININTQGIVIQGHKIALSGLTTVDGAFWANQVDAIKVKADKIEGTTAQFTSLASNILKADVITSTMIKADTALFNMLFSTESATSRLSARDAWIKSANISTLDASKITSGTIAAARLDAGAIVTAGLSANVIKSEHILGSTALIDKIFSDDAYIKRLTGKTAFISSIQAINISATRITSGTLDASKITVSNLDANSITGNKTSFVQSAWNDINSNLSVNGSELKYTHSDGSYTRINASGIQTVVGGSAYQHNYLMHIENVAINSGSDGNVQWVQLPSVFKGKQFRYFMGATDIYGAVTESAYFQNKMLLKRFVLIKHPDYNVDYTNARIPILGYAHYADIDSRQAYFRALQGIVVAQF